MWCDAPVCPARRGCGGGTAAGPNAAAGTGTARTGAGAAPAGWRRGMPQASLQRSPLDIAVAPGSACVRRWLGDGLRPAGIPAARPVRHPVSPGSACVRRRLGDGPRPAGIPAARPVRHPVSPGSACVRRRRAPDKRMRYQPMYWPPLIARLAPVIQHARSSAKKPTAKAISSGSPRRPTGICATILLRTSSGTAITMSVPT